MGLRGHDYTLSVILYADICFFQWTICIQLLVKTCDILCKNINLAPMIGIGHFLLILMLIALRILMLYVLLLRLKSYVRLEI